MTAQAIADALGFLPQPGGDSMTREEILAILTPTTSAELSEEINDETGSGALVFAVAPVLTDPMVGTQSPGDNSDKAASTAYADAAATAAAAAAVASVSGWTFVTATVGDPRTNNTLADDAELFIVIPAAGTYLIHGVLWFNLLSQTAGYQYACTYSGSSTQLSYRNNYSTIGSSSGSDNDFSFAAAAFPSGNSTGNSAANLRDWIEVVLIATSAGTFRVRHAQATTVAGSPTSRQSGSYLEWRKIA